MAVGAVVGVEVAEIHLLDRLQDRPHQMVLGHPVAQRRRHQKALLTVAFNEVRGHAGIVLPAPDGTRFPDSHVEIQHCRGALLLVVPSMDYLRSQFASVTSDPDGVEARCLLAFSAAIGHYFIAAEHAGRSRAEVRALAARRLFP